MSPKKAEEIINKYGSILGSEVIIARNISSLPCSKVKLKYAFCVYLSYLIKNNLLNQKLGEALVGTYCGIDTFIKEEDALKSKFIEIVSHQLRTPLSVIRWNLELMLSDNRFKLQPLSKETVHTTLNADIEIINRISDLLSALDIEEGRLAYLNKKQVSLEDLLCSVMIEAKKICAVKKINCSYDKPKKHLPLVDADSDKIRTVFEKIVENAISYTKENGKISASLKQIKNKIRFEIKDNGVGIPKFEQPNIFTRFYRATNARQMKPDASGLGLFIAKYFIEQHEGKIGFESEEGKGSTFWFEFPLKS